MEPVEQREGRKPHEEAIVDPLANARFGPHNLFAFYPPLEATGGGEISDRNVYRSTTPYVSQWSRKDELYEPNSEILEGVMLDIGFDIFDDNWTPFGPPDTYELPNVNSFHFAGGKVNDDLKLVNSPPREVEMDSTAFAKPASLLQFYSTQREDKLQGEQPLSDSTLPLESQPFTFTSTPSMALTASVLNRHQSDLNSSSKAQHTSSPIFRSQGTGLTPSECTSWRKPRQRATRPRIKTGCNNCKNRRVRCDESKPGCTKCLRSGRICDGYAAYKKSVEILTPSYPPSGSSNSSTASIISTPSLSWSASSAAESDEVHNKDLWPPPRRQQGIKGLIRSKPRNLRIGCLACQASKTRCRCPPLPKQSESSGRPAESRPPGQVAEFASSGSKIDSYQIPIQQIGNLSPLSAHITRCTRNLDHEMQDLTSTNPAKSNFSIDEPRLFEKNWVGSPPIHTQNLLSGVMGMEAPHTDRSVPTYPWNDIPTLGASMMPTVHNIENNMAQGSTYLGEPSSSFKFPESDSMEDYSEKVDLPASYSVIFPRYCSANLGLAGFTFPSKVSESARSSNSPVHSEYSWCSGDPTGIETLSRYSSPEPTLRESSSMYKCSCGFEPAGADIYKSSNLKRHQRARNCSQFSPYKRPETKKAYQCPYSGDGNEIRICKKQFTRADNLTRHISLKHPSLLKTVNEATRDDHTLSLGFFSFGNSLIDPELLETEIVPSAEFHVPQVPSSIDEHSSENLLEDSASRHQLQTSTTVLLKNDQTLTTCQMQDVDRPSSPALNDRITIEPIPSVQGGSSSSRNNTLSSFTEDETDWGEDEVTSSVQDLEFSSFSSISQQDCISDARLKDSLTRPVFSPMKQALIDRIMKEFWIIFNQETESIQNRSPASFVIESAGNHKYNTDKTCGRGEDSSQNSGSKSSSQTTNTTEKPTQSTLGPRKRDDEDDQEQNDEEEQSPKRPRTLLTPPRNPEDTVKFACPYRKRDPRKYCVQFWRSCALTPQDTVARVKGHLYRHHRIYPCQRCKALFENQDAVNQHLMQRNVCGLRDTEHVDGITTEIFEKLRSKKKAQRDQTEADRWKDIFKLLFPGEMIPSPYFEAVQEEMVLSPDSRELADYEEYCRRELPRTFRAALEEIVHNESQPLEESIRNQLMNIVRDCQDRVFSRYRSSTATAAVGSPSKSAMLSRSPVMDHSQESIDSISMALNPDTEARVAPPFFQPPSPQAHLRSRLEVSDLQLNTPKAPDASVPSDSGYSSMDSGNTSGIVSSSSNICDSASLSDSRSDVASAALPASVEATWNMNNQLFNANGGNVVSDSKDTSTFEGSFNNSFDNDFDSAFGNSFESSQYGSQLAYGNAWDPSMDDLSKENPFSSDETL